MKAFVSHSWKDNQVIDNFIKPVISDFFSTVTILDKENSKGSNIPYNRLVSDEIIACDVFIVIVSNNSNNIDNTDQVLNELIIARENRKKILPIKLNDAEYKDLAPQLSSLTPAVITTTTKSEKEIMDLRDAIEMMIKNSYLLVSKSKIILPSNKECNEDFIISSNVDWTIDIFSDFENANRQLWLSLNPTFGSNNKTVNISANSNTSNNIRRADIKVMSDNINKTIEVIQPKPTKIKFCQKFKKNCRYFFYFFILILIFSILYYFLSSKPIKVIVDTKPPFYYSIENKNNEDLYPISGSVFYLKSPENYYIIIYAHTNFWFIQPYDYDYLTPIDPNGNWKLQTHLGNEYLILLVNDKYQPEKRSGAVPINDVNIIAKQLIK